MEWVDAGMLLPLYGVLIALVVILGALGVRLIRGRAWSGTGDGGGKQP